VACFVLTVSDTRTAETDTGGRAIRELLEGAGHTVAGHAIVRDEPAQVAAIVRQQLAAGSARVILTTGGTGITSRDSTYEAISQLFDKRLDGFGELFRMLSYQQIGAAAMLSRACAGTIRKAAVFLILSIVLTPIVGMMTALNDDFFVLFLPLLLVFGFGLARLLHALFLEKSRHPKKDSTPLSAGADRAQQLNAAGRAALPAAQSVPIGSAANWRQPLNTSEMAQPFSITDNTTKLLKDETREK
jgi:molybdenum cofactor biosynthesis protein B